MLTRVVIRIDIYETFNCIKYLLLNHVFNQWLNIVGCTYTRIHVKICIFSSFQNITYLYDIRLMKLSVIQSLFYYLKSKMK